MIVVLFALNGLFHLLWSPLFFKFRRPDWALAEVPFLFLSIAALMVALGVSSITKALMLSRILHTTINNWRWALLWAAAAAIIAGQLIILLPQWGQLVIGIPAILGLYGLIIWTKGFGPEDRVLFTRKVTQEEPVVPPTALP